MSGKRKRVDNSGQLGLYRGAEVPLEKKRRRSGLEFEDPQPEGILIGSESLREFLEKTEQTAVFRVRKILREVVRESLVSGYRGGGRRPYHPASMLGLVLWGLMEGKTSLRQLEKVARSDVRCWWLTGGIFPDHSVIGRFLNQHAEELTEGFFEKLTRRVVQQLGSGGGTASVDGTLVQAAASRYRRVRKEAADQAAREARARADQEPDDGELKKQAEVAEEVARVVSERVRARQAQRKDASKIAVSPSELEAVIQPLKEKHLAPSYLPSIMVNAWRVIVGQAVDPKSETAVFRSLLQQAGRIDGPVKQVLADPGYHSIEVIRECRKQGVQQVLCPASPQGEKRTYRGRFAKNQFQYHELGDYYQCPAGEKLIPLGNVKTDDGNRAYRSYGRAPCGECQLRRSCTTAVSGRTIKRYVGEAYKEEVQRVMRQPCAQQQYRRRKGMVEPVFGELKHVQGLQRFRRRGLHRVRLEFALHAAAHNLRRLVNLVPDLEPFFSRFSCRVRPYGTIFERLQGLSGLVFTLPGENRGNLFAPGSVAHATVT